MTKQWNSTVHVPAFERGTTNPVVVTVTKLDQQQGSHFEIRVTDRAGIVLTCDPVFTIIRGGETQTIRGIPQLEDTVTVSNGDPGLTELEIIVNGRAFSIAHLRPNEERSIDVAAALTAGDTNTFTLTGRGPPESYADVLIWEGDVDQTAVRQVIYLPGLRR